MKLKSREVEAEVAEGSRSKSQRQREDDLHRRIAGRLKQPNSRLPKPVWEQLKKKRHISEYFQTIEGPDDNAAQTAFKQLLKDARTCLAAFRAEQRRVRVKSRRRAGVRLRTKDEIRDYIDLTECLDPGEIKRAEILARELGRLAEKHVILTSFDGLQPDKPLLAQFRDKYFGGRMLTDEEAKQFGRSLGVAIFGWEFFQEHSIPVVGHESFLMSPWDWEAEDSTQGLTPRSNVSFSWSDGSAYFPIGSRASEIDFDHLHVTGIASHPDRPLVVARDSVLYRVGELAALLSRLCPWTLQECAWFILTGLSPEITPIDIDLPDHTDGKSHACVTVSLKIHPWLSRDSLLKVYRQLQRIVIGPRNRPPTMKSLRLYELVSEQLESGATFAVALKAWLEQNPSERRRYPKRDKKSASRFSHQFRDIERQILRPFGHPDFKEKKQ